MLPISIHAVVKGGGQHKTTRSRRCHSDPPPSPSPSLPGPSHAAVFTEEHALSAWWVWIDSVNNKMDVVTAEGRSPLHHSGWKRGWRGWSGLSGERMLGEELLCSAWCHHAVRAAQTTVKEVIFSFFLFPTTAGSIFSPPPPPPLVPCWSG